MAERPGRKTARAVCARAGYRIGGHLGRDDEASDADMVASGVHQHEKSMHAGKPETKLRLRDGGLAAGGVSASRSDRQARRPKDHAGPKINILVSPNRSDGAPGQGMPPGNAPPAPPPHPVPAAPPPGGGPPGMHPPLPGGGMSMPMPIPVPMGAPPVPPGAVPPRPMNRGGNAGPGRKSMTAGSASGAGRLEKSRGLSY